MKKDPYILYNRICTLFLFFYCIIFFSPCQINAQGTTNEEVKRVQRAIFIFNFAQQVDWQTNDYQQTFKIGVLGPDRTVIDLQAMAQKRKIQGKPVEVTRFQLVKDVNDIQLLYVNRKYNYDINYILSKISGKGILLVSEDYDFNSSMINMVNVENSFEYEINVDRIAREGFKTVPSLKQYAISSSEKWKRLYQTSEKTLKDVRKEKENQEEQLATQNTKIKSQEKQIDKQEELIEKRLTQIDKQNQKIENLYKKGSIQQKQYDEKIEIEKALEQNIQEQITFINLQKEKIEQAKLAIEQKNAYLEEQNIKIKEQQLVLDEQISQINAQKKINVLLVGVIGLILVVSFFIYKGYVEKKKFTKELEAKNIAIEKQSLEIEKKNEELEQFAYIASHDLQEPLNTISSFITLIAEEYGDGFDELGKESLFYIKDASVRMKKLIDALLQYSRLGTHKEHEAVDCDTLLKELKKDLANSIQASEAKIHVEELPVVQGSEIELRLLFQNLISNAIKFRSSTVQPKIDISCTKTIDSKSQRPVWQFAIKDNGIGIPKEHQERIFAIFQRLHTREMYEGTGIGLAHCKKIVEAHQGTLWLTSEEGKGSTFYFTIPI
ncbi:YfiR/HmsC family protein [Aquimarina algicola]|uniref:histidine kinase n=1 Tax=Aquimarina algicola TaxID=2589995 RepID=A0A504J5A5_9FLAO|nr:YfiR/HmsC family protein [Aquimarina algicola]TPN82269.1 DUF4154 domain-containing protein [Aquimarina algicola]